MRRRFLLLLLLALSFGFTGQARGEEVLTLQQALKIARTANPQFRMSGEDVNVAKAEALRAKAFHNPELGVKAGTHDDLAPGEPRPFIGGEVSQEIEVWGTRGLRRKSAQKGIEVAKAHQARTWQEVAFQVKETYYETLLRQQLVSIARENLEIGKKFLGSTELKFKQNEVPYSNLLRARLELVRLNKDLISHQEDLKIARHSLNLLLGRAPETDVRLKDAFVYRGLVSSLDDLLERARTGRPEMTEVARQVEREGLNLKLAKRERLPKTTFSLWGEKDSADTHIGGGLNLEIPLWYRKKGEIVEAKALKSKAIIRQEFLNNQIDREVRDAFQELTKTARSLEVQQEATSWSAELIRTTLQAYQEGSAPFIQFLETLKAVNEFREDYFSTLAVWHIRTAALEKAIGSEE